MERREKSADDGESEGRERRKKLMEREKREGERPAASLNTSSREMERRERQQQMMER